VPLVGVGQGAAALVNSAPLISALVGGIPQSPVNANSPPGGLPGLAAVGAIGTGVLAGLPRLNNGGPVGVSVPETGLNGRGFNQTPGLGVLAPAGTAEFTGRGGVVLQRLSRNSAAEALGTKGYVLLTDECMAALGLDGAALGMHHHVERYEDVGEISCCLEDLRERWSAESERQRVYVAPGAASFERTMTIPADRPTTWEWITASEKRVLYAADDVTLMSPGGRQRAGVTNHCMHGPDVIVEHIADWRPFDYFTKAYDLPGIGRMHWTFELAESDGATTLSVRGEPLSGDRLAAWSELESDLLAALDHSAQGLVAQLA